VPAAGTVLLIIEGLQAAWGTVSRILQAFERFMAFLKAVKTAQAGPPFGAAMAAAGVVVIDFVSNWLLKRLRGPASKVAGKIREIAKKIGNKLKKAVKKLGKKFSKLKDKLFGKKGKKADKSKGREREGDHSQREAEKKREAEERSKKAQQELKGKLAKGIKGIQLKAYLLWLKAKYHLRTLKVENAGTDKVKIVGKINPEFEEWAEKISIVDKEPKPEYVKKGVVSFFRVMSIKELQRSQKNQQLNVKVNAKTREGKGEFCLTQNKEYSQDLVTRQRKQQRAEDYDYSVMVEIEMTADAMEELLQDPRYGRTAENATKHFPGVPVHTSGKRGVTKQPNVLSVLTQRGNHHAMREDHPPNPRCYGF
jgi:Skp family chaperone for outer membrane proteins